MQESHWILFGVVVRGTIYPASTVEILAQAGLHGLFTLHSELLGLYLGAPLCYAVNRFWDRIRALLHQKRRI